MTDIGNIRAVTATDGEDTIDAKISRSARLLIENETDEAPMIGFATFAVYGDGTFSLGFQCPEEHPFLGPTLFTAYLKEIIEREMTGRMAADDYAKEFLL